MLKKILEKIKEYNNICIFGHVRPDGDCYGSQFGLQAILTENFPDKNVLVVGDSCDYASFLGHPLKEEIPLEHIQNSLAIVVDCGSADRVSDQRYQEAPFVIKIDHHIPTIPYGDMVYVVEESPACCQIITEFAVTNGLKINSEAAFALYTGIVTDTGRFRFRGVTSKTMEMAGILLDAGVDIEKLDNYLSVETMNVIMYKGYILANTEFTPHGACYIKVTRDVCKEFELTDEEAASQVSLIGNIQGYPLYFLFMEYPDEIRIRLRSRGPRVDKLANLYQGGGHEKAAGAHLESWDELASFVEKADALIKYYKETGKDDLY